jgi:hypothetical protein
MDDLSYDLMPCMFCSATYKCPYCKGKGERAGLFSKKVKKCKKCKGSGACPFCLGDKKSWVANKIMKWIPENRKEDFILMRRKEVKLRRRYEYIRRKEIDVMPLEEFRKKEKYKSQVKGMNKRNISAVIEVGIDLSLQMLDDYELYIDEIERKSR